MMLVFSLQIFSITVLDCVLLCLISILVIQIFNFRGVSHTSFRVDSLEVSLGVI